jgi:hypothetical protein
MAERVLFAPQFEQKRWHLSRCTQFPESRLFIFNPFPGFDCIFTALKSRNSRHVLERIRHGEQKDVHGILIAFFDRIIGSELLLASKGSHVPALG